MGALEDDFKEVRTQKEEDGDDTGDFRPKTKQGVRDFDSEVGQKAHVFGAATYHVIQALRLQKAKTSQRAHHNRYEDLAHNVKHVRDFVEDDQHRSVTQG